MMKCKKKLYSYKGIRHFNNPFQQQFRFDHPEPFSSGFPVCWMNSKISWTGQAQNTLFTVTYYGITLELSKIILIGNNKINKYTYRKRRRIIK